MDLELSDDQRQLRNMVDRLVSDAYPIDAKPSPPQARAGWGRLADLGLLMLPFDEADGGLGGGGVEAMIVGEAFGRALVGEPYLASAVLASGALAGCAVSDARSTLIAELTLGSAIAALAEGAVATIENGRLSGRATLVLGGDIADRLIVAAGRAGAPTLVLVDADGAGVSRTAYGLHGGYGAADFVFDDAPVAAVLAEPDSAPQALARGRQAAIAFVVAEALGSAQAAFDLTVGYLKTRVQFGRPLGANQALQHRAAEMYVELEQLRSAALYAAALGDEPDADARARGLSAAKVVADRASRFIGQQAVQLHGGIGVTQDYAVGRHFKRLTAIGLLFGDTDAHLADLAARGGFVGPQPYWRGDGAGVGATSC